MSPLPQGGFDSGIHELHIYVSRIHEPWCKSLFYDFMNTIFVTSQVWNQEYLGFYELANEFFNFYESLMEDFSLTNNTRHRFREFTNDFFHFNEFTYEKNVTFFLQERQLGGLVDERNSLHYQGTSTNSCELKAELFSIKYMWNRSVQISLRFA